MTDPIARLRAARAALEQAEAHFRGLEAQIAATRTAYEDALADVASVLGRKVTPEEFASILEELDRQVAADTEVLAGRIEAVRATIDKETK